MDLLLHKLGVSVKHLAVLHGTLTAHYPEYREANDKIMRMELGDFGRELYAGGKRGSGLARQMILADIFQYIFVGRGYFAAVRSAAQMRRFIELLFRVANLLILQENLSVRPKLRLRVIKALEKKVDAQDFIEPGYEGLTEEMNSLKAYDGWIVGQEGKDFERTFDSLLPKRLGLAVELIVFAMLLLKRYGYIVPLLLSQRLIRGGGHATGIESVDYLAPPDFLLLRDRGQVFGVEVGSAKDDQNAKFCAVTSIPLFPVRLGDHRQPQPYRCGKCGNWITYSDYILTGLISGTVSPDVVHVRTDQFLDKTTPGVEERDLVFYGQARDHKDTLQTLRYHYICVKNQDVVQDRVKGRTGHKSTGLILPVPCVKGLENLREN